MILFWQFLIANKMWFYIWGIMSYHYSCTNMVISIALLSTTQWNLIKLNYRWTHENDSNVYHYLFIHSQETNIVDLFRYSKSQKFTLFSQNLLWGNSGSLHKTFPFFFIRWLCSYMVMFPECRSCLMIMPTSKSCKFS